MISQGNICVAGVLLTPPYDCYIEPAGDALVFKKTVKDRAHLIRLSHSGQAIWSMDGLKNGFVENGNIDEINRLIGW